MPAIVESVNVGGQRPHPAKPTVRFTGIDKRPTTGAVEVRAPGDRRHGLGSGLVSDFIGNHSHHGGDLQAVYAFQREDLDRWATRLGRGLVNGCFGENLTTAGLDVNAARVGERWRVGSPTDDAESVELEVTVPRIPCATFASWLEERGWIKRFTAEGRPGTYLRVVRPGRIRAGDPVMVVYRPDHDVSVQLVFRATTTQRQLLPQLAPARAYLEPKTLELVERSRTMALDRV